MNSKKAIITTLSLLVSALLIVGTVNVLIDPLFLYHKPWFGLEANVINERYQNAGIAKNFDFENVIIGNSMSQNFVVSEVEEVFGGKTVKLTAAGSHMLDWSYVLDVLTKRENHPKNIIINFDTGFIVSSNKETNHEMPTFLYDDNYLNDVEYLFNFTIFNKYTYGTLKANSNDRILDYDRIFSWAEEDIIGKDKVLKGCFEEKEQDEGDFQQELIFYTEENLELLKLYLEVMPNTQFVFFFSPFSILYWNNITEIGLLDECQSEFEKAFRFMSQYDNVTMYFWTDDEMLKIISDLDNYRDSTHFGAHISSEILRRIDAGIGLISKEASEWQTELDRYFTYLENFDYKSIFV